MNELPITVIGTLSLFPETKEQQAIFVANLKHQVMEGEIDPLKAEAIIANLESVCKSYRTDKELKEVLLNAAEKFGSKSFDAYNAKFTIKETGVKYDFLHCGHPRYNQIAGEIERLKAECKQLEDELKIHKSMWIYTDLETGEISEVLPAVKSSTTSVAVEINKTGGRFYPLSKPEEKDDFANLF